jgi:hypothetical protein
MKFYKRDPNRALAGMAALTSAQRGIYNSIIDLLYARDGLLPCASDDDDRRIAKYITIDIREWRRIKRQLMQLDKIRVTNDGLLDANGVAIELRSATDRSEIARKSATHRWDLFRLSKKFNAPAMRQRNATQIQSKSSEIPSPIEHAKPLAVDNGDNSIGAEPETTTKSIATDELATLVKSKWLGR